MTKININNLSLLTQHDYSPQKITMNIRRSIQEACLKDNLTEFGLGRI